MDSNDLPDIVINPNILPSRIAISQLFDTIKNRLSDEQWNRLNDEQKRELISLFYDSAIFSDLHSS